MNIELHYLVLVTALTALLWVPYILNRIAVRGIADAVGYPANPKPQSAWAQRLQQAHGNAVENLVVFAALVLAAHAAGVSSETTAFAAKMYFWARLVHAVAYTLAWPWVRTLAFAAGFASQATFAWLLLS
ncbi:MAG: MAPEG family protein [Steroidobacteraceae bacterium]|nr:MAPEG family protein [Steroidobacteraceae bacterium]